MNTRNLSLPAVEDFKARLAGYIGAGHARISRQWKSAEAIELATRHSQFAIVALQANCLDAVSASLAEAAAAGIRGDERDNPFKELRRDFEGEAKSLNLHFDEWSAEAETLAQAHGITYEPEAEEIPDDDTTWREALQDSTTGAGRKSGREMEAIPDFMEEVPDFVEGYLQGLQQLEDQLRAAGELTDNLAEQITTLRQAATDSMTAL
ncbi:hypothetical protein [Xanthomonas hortorum]|uniref:hypothetical protein n=1 Tax=Xanthomonas hortorum TaxID=56454 RepID=UPI0009383D93|nr:hypothetical protein [Xanthomonas hortorum]APP87409.1 hypothetical protein BI317_25505 [Xanthomonas hortorum pv. gardneri]ASW48742.1 hypothetical protein XJ27_22215 [Xanthomonas hortorum]MCE4300095.1 hypothetical protein [Xanthomonas hortorum pv. vitians]MCE4307357.1 hypothetical protein [Xanthomonas hortorum pv. vitians]MCE4312793.1 hypothetical protein [Xanthomonas hortorum pv. vitians]